MPRSSHTTRQRLLNTAKELFARQGITHTTTRQIAEAAGVNEVTLFRHFKSKQGLLLAVFADLGVFRGITDLPTWMRVGSGMRISRTMLTVAFMLWWKILSWCDR
ncbi:MAG: helix-turn-helix transcriptional regulator [Synechococcaceae cyanobacterium SM2_3_1]|nr:helix-turn-helix transcriptional regulator [Synechococcaceae cyanobacterium SM2_3_1]